MCKYVTNCFQNHNKIDDFITSPCNCFILCFGSESPTLINFIFRGIELEFGGGVNSETLVSYFI